MTPITRNRPKKPRTPSRGPNEHFQGSSIFSKAQWDAIAYSLSLSPRELEIVKYVFDDECEEGMAFGLRISRHTVHSYINRLYRKIGVGSRPQLLVCVFYQSRGL